MPKIICFKITSYYHNDLLINSFQIKKTKELVVGKYFKLTFYQDIEAYIKGCNVCLASKIVCYKPYKYL